MDSLNLLRYLTHIPRLSHCPVCDLLVDNRRKGGPCLLKMVDNGRKVCFLGKHTHWREPVLS